MEDVINKYYDDIIKTYGKMFLPVIKEGGNKKMILYLAIQLAMLILLHRSIMIKYYRMT